MPDSIFLQCLVGGLSAVGLVSLFWLAAGIILSLSSPKNVKIHTLVIPGKNADLDRLVRAARWRASFGCCGSDIIVLLPDKQESKPVPYDLAALRVRICRPEGLPGLMDEE